MADAKEIATLLRHHRFNACGEDDLQRGIEKMLTDAGIAFEREFHLDAHSRIDFLVGDIGIEVKVDGSLNDVMRQVQRYLGFEHIGSLVVVTTRSRHRALPLEMRGKQIHVVTLLTGLL